MIIRRVHATRDYYTTAAGWLATNWCPYCVVTAITAEQHKQETGGVEG